MALTFQQQNFVTDLMSYSATIRTNQLAGEDLVARYNNNSFSTTIVAADLLAFAPTSHLTPAKIAGAITAINAIIASLGTDSAGNAVNIIAMKG